MNDDFINYLKQWLIKAQENLFVAERLMEYEYRAKGAIGFHCQQSVEKYLKAFLIYHRKELNFFLFCASGHPTSNCFV